MAPSRVGSNMQSKYVFGHNPRESHLSSMEGVTPPGRKKSGMTSDSAPQKTDMEHFDSKHGFAGGFGRTGLTGES
jgi:hypothetical protein